MHIETPMNVVQVRKFSVDRIDFISANKREVHFVLISEIQKGDFAPTYLTFAFNIKESMEYLYQWVTESIKGETWESDWLSLVNDEEVLLYVRRDHGCVEHFLDAVRKENISFLTEKESCENDIESLAIEGYKNPIQEDQTPDDSDLVLNFNPEKYF